MLRIFKTLTKPARNCRVVTVGAEELAKLAGERADNLFIAHGLSCSEAVLVVLDRGFGGGLGVEMALGIGSGFGGGIGGAGCVCGALSGAVAALGLFLGAGRYPGYDKKEFRLLVAGMHDRFRERSASTCCRQLLADFRGKRSERKYFCGDLTRWSANEAARIILVKRPELSAVVEYDYLNGRDSRFDALADRLFKGRLLAGSEKKD